MTTDADGYVYLAGTIYGNFDGSDKEYRDLFLAKYSPEGERMWIRQFDSPAWSYALDLKFDGSGFLHIVVSRGYRDNNLLLVKCDSFGRVLELREMKNDGWESIDGKDLAIGANDEIWITGSVSGAFPGFSSSGHVDAFLAKYKGFQ